LHAPLFQEAPNFRKLLFRSMVSRAHAHTHTHPGGGGGGWDTYQNQMLVLVIVLSSTCVHSVILKMSAKKNHKTLSLSDKCTNHKTLSLSDKSTILQHLNKGESSANLAREFNVGKSTISDFKKKIERKFCHMHRPPRKVQIRDRPCGQATTLFLMPQFMSGFYRNVLVTLLFQARF
jgi:hypothetical protein